MFHRRLTFFLMLASLGLLSSCATKIQTSSGWEWNDISAVDAGNRAAFFLVDGLPDPNSGDLEVLNDGLGPKDPDQPKANFFFTAGSKGGRILMDLGSVIDIRQVLTYSWHAGSRGPQVYRLYAGDSSSPGFSLRPDGGTDPLRVGWKRIADVDTRRGKAGGPGGQYRVNNSDPSGRVLAKTRYLLFDIACTETDDAFGNTFYSEIDVNDGRDHPSPIPKAFDPSDPQSYQWTFDTNDYPEIKPWVESSLQPLCRSWYPLIVGMLPSRDFQAQRYLQVVFKKESSGTPAVAHAAGNVIVCNGPWFLKNKDGESLGALVHEMVHVVQQYSDGSGPGWLSEGIADYIRWYRYEPPEKLRPINAAEHSYTEGYQAVGAFLSWLSRTRDKDIVVKFNAALREKRYNPSLWEAYLGATPDKLWNEFVRAK